VANASETVMSGALGRMVVGNILASAANRQPDAIAFICSGTKRRFTFAQADERSNRLAHALMRQGLRKGDVLAVLVSNRMEIVETYFALARTGIVGLPLNYRLAVGEIVELMRTMGAKGLLYEARFEAAAVEAQRRLPDLRHVIRVGGDETTFGSDYESLLRVEPTDPPAVDVGEDDPFYFNLTSGTTGVPKSYILTHYNNCLLSYVFTAFDMTRDDIVMTVFPIFGRVGFSWIIGSLLYGVPNVLANFEPDAVLDLLAAEGVSMVNLVPTMAAMLLPVQKASPRSLKRLRAIVFAGASLAANIRNESIATLCRDIYEYYGMNEMGPLVLSNPADRMMRPGSVGKPLTFAELKIVGDDGQPVGANEIGEILGRSPMTVTSYFDNPEKSAETFRDGWLHTGDLGYIDEDGYLFVSGRKKDMIVTGGQNVYPAEIEEIIMRFPEVADCAVIGLPDELWGERVTSIVVPRQGTRPTAAELDAFCRQYLAGFKIPKEFIFDSQTLPRTPTGKVQKFLLVERLSREARPLTSPQGVLS
jgi:acyl-CoA synthetase (AMP-forming)/AMP-acid ligase II